jgi:putative DNA methylase
MSKRQMTTPKAERRLIENDDFPFEFISQVAERESWRKEIHRPIYHLHKWWALRLGSIFRGVLLGSVLNDAADLRSAFYERHDFGGTSVLDPFMGSGTTIGEAHKLGFTGLGRDINPVAVEAVRVAFGAMDRQAIADAYAALDSDVGTRIRGLYRGKDADGEACDVLYHFWVMQVRCVRCASKVDLFSSFVFAANAYPKRRPEVQIVCPTCGGIFQGLHGRNEEICPDCATTFDPQKGNAKGQSATCPSCSSSFTILDALARSNRRPDFRLYAKLVLRADGTKQYVQATEADRADYTQASATLASEVASGAIRLPDLALADGYNTAQSMRYGFTNWRQFFNDRQLLALGWLRAAIAAISDQSVREVLLTLFSGLLEFNNMFASYKGEGTGAVRHMFSHHILKPERTPIEANVWGTPKSSGSFSGLFKGRLQRALEYREYPTEVSGGNGGKAVLSSGAFSGRVSEWPSKADFATRSIYLSCGDSSDLGLPDQSVDLVITDPPFFDNVQYSELADFFYAWQQIGLGLTAAVSTRADREVQDTNVDRFAAKLQGVFRECHRVLKTGGLLAFTYHHSREEGWHAVAHAVLGAGFVVVNSHPVKGEMSVATPVTAAHDPISFDIVLVCRKASEVTEPREAKVAISAARAQLARLADAGFRLSRADRRIVEFGQLLTTVRSADDVLRLADHPDLLLVEAERDADEANSEALRQAAW